MPQHSPNAATLDKLYLRFFKYAVVGLMTLALLAVVVMLPMAAYQYFQTPLPPTPAKAAPQRAVNLEDLKKFLIDEEKRRKEQEKGGNAPVDNGASAAPTAAQIYAEQATALYVCSEEFRKLAQQPVGTATTAELDEQWKKRRAWIEQMAENRFRGPSWPKALVTFACDVLKNPEIAQLKKDGLIGTVVSPTLLFHARAWANIEEEKFNFDQGEKQRVQGEIAAEAARVAIAKAKAMFLLSLAGGAILFFLIMALYLIFAKIEDNLALIHLAIVGRTVPAAAPVSVVASS